MARVTSSEVRAIIDVKEDRSITPFIETATLIVDEEIAGSGLSDARLKQIELYLAAHFAAITEERGNIHLEQVGSARQISNQIKKDGLSMTRYGQQAINLDTTGKLAAYNTVTKRAEFRVV